MSKLIPEQVIDDVVRVYRPTPTQITILHLLWDAEPKAVSGKDLADSLKTTRLCARQHIWAVRRRMKGCKTVEVCGRQGHGYWLEYRK